jgi:N-acetylglutamate synthase-like GNAT family acetyltransferase
MSNELANMIEPSSAVALPPPRVAITIRAATPEDFRFIDDLQAKHSRQIGFMHEKTIRGKIALGHVLVAEDGAKRPVGYCIGCDRYFKRDDVGVIYHMNIAPDFQRGYVGAALLKAMFDRAAYGCKLFSLWCAQDIDANRFWESMGFVPLAFRAGGRSKKRVHIFWQKRIREGDNETPYWYPSLTNGGAIAEDRLVFPIPPGTHWSDAKPIVLPGMETPKLELHTPKRSREKKPKPLVGQGSRHLLAPVQFASAISTTPTPKPKREKPPKQKHDPKYVAAARELRDRYLEHINSNAAALPAAERKYEVTRALRAPDQKHRPLLDAA